MKSRFVISENERRSILSMYGLLKEDTTKITIKGTITDEKGNKVIYEKIHLDGDEKNLTKSMTDGDGNYQIYYDLDSEKNYFLKILDSKNYDEKVIEIMDKKTTPQTINIVLKNKDSSKKLGEKTLSITQTFNLEIEVMYLENKLEDYNVKIKNSKNSAR